MRLISIPLLLLSLLIHAQPGDKLLYYLDPCGFSLNDSIDLTNDGVADLMISGRSEGTDDVPSSSGNCREVLVCLPGTTLLSLNHGGGSDEPERFGISGSLRTDRPETDQLLPAQHWISGELVLREWGYGAAARSSFAERPEKYGPVSIARIRTKDADTLVAFLLSVNDTTQDVVIEVLARSAYTIPLTW